jgi:glycosyltransferase involved in cell wall biosynthesis
MNIIVLGTRGIPNIQGGVETHCENLFPEIAKMGCKVTIIRRSPYISEQNRINSYKDVVLKDIFAPHKKSIEAIIHTSIGLLYSAIKRPDILHIHSIGPSLLVPLARLFGLKVVVTNHGPDYNRQKWGCIAKFFLRLGERFGANYANEVIVISQVINSILELKYKRNNCNLIYNGVNIPSPSIEKDYIESLGLEKNKYIIAVGRFVEEKGFHILLAAIKNLDLKNYKLVLVGDADLETKYSKELKKEALVNKIILTGYIYGEKLNQIFSHAFLFVMPSFHEGLPIALLEAMSYNLSVLVSNIPANLEVDLDEFDYFKCGDITDLTFKLQQKINNPVYKNWVPILQEKYNWKKIAEQTFNVYKNVVLKQKLKK